MAIYLFPQDVQQRAAMLRPVRPAPRWFELPAGWHVTAGDLAFHLVRAVRNGTFNNGLYYSVQAVEPDGSIVQLPICYSIHDAIAMANERQAIANADGNPLAWYFEVRTRDYGFPVYRTKGGAA